MYIRNKKLICSIVWLFILLASLSFADEKTKQVDKLFAKWDKQDSPGCALAIIHNEEIIYKKGYGMANLELNVPITTDSVFYLGSVSKQFVAMCIALLKIEGKLALDDNIRKFLPEIPDYDSPITIRHLIYHTSGIRDYLNLEGITGIPLGSYHEEDVLDLICRQKELNFSPGEEHLYSNSGYFLLAVIVQRASGISIREYADEHIFQPLGMTHTFFHDDYTRLIKNRASGYFRTGKDQYTNFLSTFDNVGSGGLFSSVEDLYHWDQNFYHHKVGGKKVYELMHTTGFLNSGKKLDYAFAINVTEYKGLKTVSHGGALGGYRSSYLQFPEEKFAVVCLANMNSINPTGLCYQIAEIYLGEQMISDKPDEETQPVKESKYLDLPSDKLDAYTGDYIREKSMQIIRAFLKGGSLWLRISGSSYKLAAKTPSSFDMQGVPEILDIKFESQSDDKPALLHFIREGQDPAIFRAYKRVKPSEAELAEYEGNYWSDELQVMYTIQMRNGRLYFVHKNALDGYLVPQIQDGFTFPRFNVRFERNQKNEVSVLYVLDGRVRSIRFDKQ